MRRTIAPPRSQRAARLATLDAVDWIFGLAHEMTGAHAPYEMDPEREAIDLIHEGFKEALLSLSKRNRLRLGHYLWEVLEARDFEIASLERDYENQR